jgi:deoxyhypusine monooxygenase
LRGDESRKWMSFSYISSSGGRFRAPGCGALRAGRVRAGPVTAAPRAADIAAMRASDEALDGICFRVTGPGQPVASRMRAIFALKSHGGPRAVETLAAAMRLDPSVLVKHEAAYCLGQMGDSAALPPLEEALRDEAEDVVVRHEAAEALGAVGDPSALDVLDLYADGKHPQEVYETCRLSASRIRLCAAKGEEGADGGPEAAVAYTSVDPAPATCVGAAGSVASLGRTLCDLGADMFERYRAMFALRNVGGDEAVRALCDGMRADSTSALFRHEVAFVLGQMQSPASVATLAEFLRDTGEHEMVRHEAAEALGSIATPECRTILAAFRADPNAVVRESVAVALDVADYVGDESALHYADVAPGAAAAVAQRA